MSDCRVYQELISRMLDDELSLSERAALQEHMDGCDECRSLYSVFSGVSAAVSSQLEEPPAKLREKIMAQLRREEIKKSNTKRLPKPVRNILAAAACVAVLVGAAMGFGPEPNKSGAISADQASQPAAQGYSLAEGENDMSSRKLSPEAAPAEGALVSPETDIADNANNGFAIDSVGVNSANEPATADAPEYQPDDTQGQTALDLDWSSLSQLLGTQSCQLSLEELSPCLCHVLSLSGGEGELVYVYEYQDEIYYCLNLSGEIFKASCSPSEFESEIIGKNLQ